jgi:hypothetical protein
MGYVRDMDGICKGYGWDMDGIWKDVQHSSYTLAKKMTAPTLAYTFITQNDFSYPDELHHILGGQKF